MSGPARLTFKIVKCSSEDPENPVSELLGRSSKPKGWRSAHSCEFPQEIGIQFETPVRLREVRLLSHQSIIATKLELSISLPQEGQDANYETSTFKKLGFTGFDNNERSQFRDKENKTLRVDVPSLFLRIRLHKCHTNYHNTGNQVALMQLQCLGEAIVPIAGVCPSPLNSTLGLRAGSGECEPVASMSQQALETLPSQIAEATAAKSRVCGRLLERTSSCASMVDQDVGDPNVLQTTAPRNECPVADMKRRVSFSSEALCSAAAAPPPYYSEPTPTPSAPSNGSICVDTSSEQGLFSSVDVRSSAAAELLVAGMPDVQDQDMQDSVPNTEELLVADIMDASSSSSESAPNDCTRPLKTIVVNGVVYTRLQLIGRGGTSKVYQVRDASGNERALKTVRVSEDAQFEALADEVNLLQSLKGNSRIIQVFDAQVHRNRWMMNIVMEQGEMDLGRFLQSSQDIGLSAIQGIWRHMLEAVKVVHDARIIHSDLKPANFILVAGQWKLIDFGISKRIACETTHIGRDGPVGTISYMAPEAVQTGAFKVGRASDIWSLGIILYQILYRSAPFSHLEPMQRLFALSDPNLQVEFPPGHCLDSHSESVKAHLIDVLNRCLQRDPTRRASIPELLAHDFLLDSLRVDRSSVDRAIEALVAGFYAVAKEEMCNGERAGDVQMSEEDDLPSDRWQALADEVWHRMASGGADSGPDAGMQNLRPALEPFRKSLQQWLVRGDAKRQRVDSSFSATPDSQRNGAGAAASAVPSRAPTPPVRSPAYKRSGAAKVSAADAAAAAVWGAQKAQSPRGHGSKSSARRPLGPSIQADQLLTQRKGLRKTPSREAFHAKHPPPKKQPSVAANDKENIVVRRLKDRQAADLEEKTDCIEDTQLTRWN